MCIRDRKAYLEKAKDKTPIYPFEEDKVNYMIIAKIVDHVSPTKNGKCLKNEIIKVFDPMMNIQSLLEKVSKIAAAILEEPDLHRPSAVSYTHLRAHETPE